MRIVITFQWRGDKSPAYIPLIDMAFQSAKGFGYETVLICNSNTNCSDDLLILSEKEEPHLMNWILAAQLAFIESPLFDQPSVLFSPDALVLKPLEPVFDQDFDIAFTDRDNKRWPINNGVIFLKPENKAKIAAFWRECIAVCKAYPVDVQEWYGDQQSLHDCYVAGVHEKLGLKIPLLPCSVYNATPDKNAGAIDRRMLKQAYIAHFKGNRKHMMQSYRDFLCCQA